MDSVPVHHLVEVFHCNIGRYPDLHVDEGLRVIVEARHLYRIQQRPMTVYHTGSKEMKSLGRKHLANYHLTKLDILSKLAV